MLSFLTRAANLPTLRKLLRYHVLPGRLLTKDVRSRTVSTLEGSELFLKVDTLGVSVEDAMDTAARVMQEDQSDLVASNGVVHMIDHVLVPESLIGLVTVLGSGLTQAPTASLMGIPTLVSSLPELSTLVSLLNAAGLVDLLSSWQLTVFAPTNDAFAKLPEALVSFLTRPENKQTLVRD